VRSCQKPAAESKETPLLAIDVTPETRNRCVAVSIFLLFIITKQTPRKTHIFLKNKKNLHFYMGAKIENHHTTAAKFVGNTQGSLVVACVHCLSAQLGGRRKQTDRFV